MSGLLSQEFIVSTGYVTTHSFHTATTTSLHTACTPVVTTVTLTHADVSRRVDPTWQLQACVTKLTGLVLAMDVLIHCSDRINTLTEDLQQRLTYQQRVQLFVGVTVVSAAYLRRLTPSLASLVAITPLLVLNLWLPLIFNSRADLVTRIVFALLTAWLANFKVRAFACKQSLYAFTNKGFGCTCKHPDGCWSDINMLHHQCRTSDDKLTTARELRMESNMGMFCSCTATSALYIMMYCLRFIKCNRHPTCVA